MNTYEKYIPTCIALFLVVAVAAGCYYPINDLYQTKLSTSEKLQDVEKSLKDTNDQLAIVNKKLKAMSTTSTEALKKVYSPTEADMDRESLFFTLYTDMISLAKDNNIKIRSIVPEYKIKGDNFVDKGGNSYFVCDLNMKLVSNYKDLRNFIEALFDYDYYMRFNKLSVIPYPADKKVLLSDFSIRLYSHTDVQRP